MLLCVWPALNPLSIHETFNAIVPGAYPGEVNKCTFGWLQKLTPSFLLLLAAGRFLCKRTPWLIDWLTDWLTGLVINHELGLIKTSKTSRATDGRRCHQCRRCGQRMRSVPHRTVLCRYTDHCGSVPHPADTPCTLQHSTQLINHAYAR